MALGAKSLFNYGLEVTTLNNSLDFKTSSMGPTLTVFLNPGFYSPSGLAAEVAFQIQSIDLVNIYTVSIARNIMGGTQNRMTISTNGSFLSLLFSSGPNFFTSCSSLIGFLPADYTGSTSYTGASSLGTILIPDYIGYNYLDPQNMAKLFGAVNVSASGLKEATVFSVQYFIQVDYKYENKSRLIQWVNFFTWAIQQRMFEYTPEISNSDYFFNVTLESTQYDAKGLGFQMTEMLPDFPNVYQTGALKFRVIPT